MDMITKKSDIKKNRPTVSNKKAILFSLISVLFSVLFITIFSQNFSTMNEDKIPGSNIRIKVIDNYVRNFETYIGDSIKLSTYRTLDEITKYRNGIGFFNNFNQFNTTFYSCMTCGRVTCPGGASCNLGNNYLTARLDNITTLSQQELNILTTYRINSIEITQKYPFEIDVTLDISYNVTDDTEGSYYARWNKRKNITQSVTIIGLLDPTGYIADSTVYSRTIRRYSGACQFDEACWNYTTTQDFYQGSSFRYYSNGTSFLNRYWNNNTGVNCCGIETIIHPSEITGINVNNSYIDHYYWNGSYTCGSGKSIVSITFGPDEIHLDGDTAIRYGLSNDSKPYCTP
ncbi:MAG: hypothetical protein ACP5NW_03105 [Candidatus Woesearchaeota archaeon]